MVDLKRKEPNEDWLALREASRQMGVSAQTLRSWADAGRVPSYRTPGGHRRFQVSGQKALSNTSNPRGEMRWRLLGYSALGRVRMMLETQESAAQAISQEAAAARAEHRELGRALITLLVLGLQHEHSDIETRANELGRRYTELHQRIGLSAPDAVAALGLFRTAFNASVIEFAFGVGEPTADGLMAWLRRGNEIIDRVCVSMLEFMQEVHDLHGDQEH